MRELQAKLTLAQNYQQNHCIRVKFRQSTDRFYHLLNLESGSLADLRAEIGRKLGVGASEILLVKDGDTMLSEDSELFDGLCVDVYLI